MKISKLKYKYCSGEDRSKYKKTKKLCVNSSRKNKKLYFNNLNINNLSDGKKFWKNTKGFFSDKRLNF